jgi:hypothetical protein
MGVVFRAHHLATDREVALKLIHPTWANNDYFRTRFEREVRALARLDHPNIVAVYDAATWQGLPYMTMKYVAGKTLSHHRERLRPDPRAVCRILVQVARAVHYLHTNGIVHRDLKPLNILLTADDVPLVADFGLVRVVDESSDLSITLVPLGTRQYMSPEQTLGGSANYPPACDIWALGVILYELLAGDRPFGHGDPVELYRMIRHDPTPPIRAEAGAPPGLEAIARKCLAKAVADRYATAEAVAADLERWLAGEEIPLPPAPPTATERAPAKPSTAPPVPHRRRLRWALVAVVLFSTLAFGGAPQLPQRVEEAPPPRGIAERLAAGETVWLIGEKGLPLIPAVPLPGCRAPLTRDASGYASLSSAGTAAVGWFPGPLPSPTLFHVEYAVLLEQNTGSYAGAFVGQRTVPGRESEWVTLIQVAQSSRVLRIRQERADVEERAVLQMARWTIHPPGTLSDLATDSTEVTRDLARRGRLDWRTIEFRIEPNQVIGRWENRELRPFTADAVRLFLSTEPGLQPAAPVIGSGIGLTAHNAEVVFRNARLTTVRHP